MRQPVLPVEAQPVHVSLDGVDVLVLSLPGLVSSKRREGTTAGFGGDAEIQANRHDMADMQVAVRLRREAGHDFGVLARLQVVVNDLADKVPRFVSLMNFDCFRRGGIVRELFPGQFAYNIAPSCHYLQQKSEYAENYPT